MNSLLIHHLIFIFIVYVFIFSIDISESTLVSLSGANYSCSGQLNYIDICSNAFDNNITTYWLQNFTSTSPQKQNVVITLDFPMYVTSYEVYMLSYMTDYGLYGYSYQVTSWTLEGSNTGSSYSTVSTVTWNYTDINNIKSPGSFILFNCSSPASYKYYRFNVIGNFYTDSGYGYADDFILIELVLLNGTSQPSPTPSPTSIVTTPSIQSTKKNVGAVVGGIIGALVVVAIVVALVYRSYKLKKQPDTVTTVQGTAMSPISHKVSVSKEQQNPMQSKA